MIGSGGSPAYRGAVVRCPACGEVMRSEMTCSAALEVCDACEGLWLDWFDGEVATVAVEHEAARLERGSSPPSRPSRVSGSGACPRCTRPLVAELYSFADVSAHDLITGVELLRCPECAGAFVPRGSAHLLLEHDRETKTQTPIEAIRGLVRHLLGRRK